MLISHNQVLKVIEDMSKMSKEIDKERNRINYKGPEDDNSYIVYREGYYDACYDLLINLAGYSPEEIEELESGING